MEERAEGNGGALGTACITLAVEGGILRPDTARGSPRCGLGEVGRQAMLLLVWLGDWVAEAGNVVAAAMLRACAPESGVGTKLGSNAILLGLVFGLLVIDGGS